MKTARSSQHTLRPSLRRRAGRLCQAGLLACFVATTQAAAPSAAPATAAWVWQLPPGFPPPPVPADNPMSSAKVALGRRLFFDPQLSVTGRTSCASCHDPARSFSDGRALAVGATGSTLIRNALALVNVAYNSSYGWDNPQMRSLEAQMRVPLFNTHPVEMGLAGREALVIAALRRDGNYATSFANAFPESAQPVGIDNLIRAIAAYERTLIFGNSPFDRYVYAGEHNALSESAKQGMALFFSGRAGCAMCHRTFNFSGVANEQGRAPGVPAFACNGTGRERLRIPTLRNLTLTAPYMHDGRYATLDEVISHYERGGEPGSCPDSRRRPVKLTDSERRSLREFLQSLTSPAPEVRATP